MTSRKTSPSPPQVGPAESEAARLTDQRAEGSRLADALHESEERFRSLFENTIYGILLTAPDGSILAANSEACRLLGRTEQEICAAGQAGIFDSSDPTLQIMLQDRAAAGEVRGELTMIRADGLRFPVEFSSAVFTDGPGSQLLAKGEVIGLLQLDHRDPRRFTPADVDWLLGFGRHVAVAIVNAWLYEAAQRAAVLAERERLSRELHDTVSQVLYSIGLAAHATRGRLAPDMDWVAARMDHLEKLAETGLAEMRVALLGLQPEILLASGLVKGLEQQAEMLRGRYDLNVETRFGAEPDISNEAKLALYRIAQEATNNVGKHAQAQNATVSLASDGRAVTLEISDDGHGFAPAGSFPRRFGLKTMQERAHKIGATWEIASDAGRGTRIRVRLPLGEPDAPHPA